MVSVCEVLKELYTLDGDSVGRWIVQGLTRLTPEMLKECVYTFRDPLELVEFLNLENPFLKTVAKRFVLIPYWERVEFVLTDKWELYNKLSEDPDKKEILDTKEGNEWLNYVKNRSYEYFYNYTWGEQCRDQRY